MFFLSTIQLRFGLSLLNFNAGELPVVSEDIVNRTICIKQGVDCCSVQLNIRVKNCTGFYVYYLTSLPECYSVYCFGEVYIRWLIVIYIKSNFVCVWYIFKWNTITSIDVCARIWNELRRTNSDDLDISGASNHNIVSKNTNTEPKFIHTWSQNQQQR